MAEASNFVAPTANTDNYVHVLGDDEEEEIDYDETCFDDESFYENQMRQIANVGGSIFEIKPTSQENYDASPTYRSELKNIYNVLMRSRDEIASAGGDVSADVRDDFQKYKETMQDITQSGDGGVMKRVLRAGSGAAAAVGNIVKYHYCLQIEAQDEPFDSSVARGRVQKIKLGDGKVIAGLELALSTMKEGESSDFIIDPDYAFGVHGCPPRIPESCTIRATVTLLECIEEDPVDAMTTEQRRELKPKETMEYIARKMELGKKLFNSGLIVAAINRYKDARLQAELPVQTWSEGDKMQLSGLRRRLYKNLAVCYMKIAMMNQTVNYLKKLEKLTNDRDSKMHFLWAKVYHNEGEYAKAIDELRAAQQLEPGNVEITKLLEQVQNEKSQYDATSKEQAKRMLSG